MHRIVVIEGDITRERVDAIVNAANERLLGGGGVDGAIHRAAGPALLEACRRIPEISPGVRCPTGQARVTDAFGLPARMVIHTVGPIWRGGKEGEPELLAASYKSSLSLAVEKRARTIAFPSISTGVYGFPKELAAAIAVRTIADNLSSATNVERVLLVAFGAADAAPLSAALAAHHPIPEPF